MKRLIALFTAFALFLVTVAVGHMFAADRLNFNNPQFGTWINSKKFQYHNAVTSNLSANSIVVFGSSELAHGRKTAYHPQNMFRGQALDMMMIGAGYYQSLSHATMLSAIEPDMKNKKAVLILSPQWFRKTGVLPEAYASRFSEDNYIEMLKNPALSDKTKEYIIARTERLMKGDQPTLKRVKLYERIFWTHDADLRDRVRFQMQYEFLQEKSKLSLVTTAYARGLKQKTKADYEKPVDVDWDAYLKAAERSGKKATGSNPYYVNDRYYYRHLKPNLVDKADYNGKGSYTKSPEYNDLRCFLDVCRDLEIEPLLVSIPVNGWWYDYVGFSKDNREQYYENIRRIADEYNVQLADYSDQEYTKYFLEDTIHLGWKGWVMVNESIYNFTKETK